MTRLEREKHRQIFMDAKLSYGAMSIMHNDKPEIRDLYLRVARLFAELSDELKDNAMEDGE